MQPVVILAIQRISAEDRARIEAVDPRLHLIDAGGWFDGEYRETWPSFTVQRYLGADANGRGDRAERDRLLSQAEIILGGFPFPLDLRARSPRLKWFHQRPAGASNLLRGDLWNSDVVVTTSRGAANSLAIAEYAVAGILHLAKGLNQAAGERERGIFQARSYRPVLLQGKTACIIGVGGIGQEVGRLCAALGMRVVGTRRDVPSEGPPVGFAEVHASADLDHLLPEADVVAVCCQWTPATDKLLNQHRFGLMKPGAMLVNVARGEIIDEDALIESLAQSRLRGVVLDVYVGEFERPPSQVLWQDHRVLITPHISAAGDRDLHGGMTVFCDNLSAWLAGGPMHNVVDWVRGY